MTTFRSATLRVLDRLLNLDGSQVTLNQLDMSAPVQPVLNVSRLAELGAGAGNYNGFAQFAIANTHAVVGASIVGTLDFIPTMLAAMGVRDDTHWVWLLEASVLVDSGLTLVNAGLAIRQAAIGGAINLDEIMTHYWDLKGKEFTTIAAPNVAAIRATSDPRQVNLPRLLPRGSVVDFASTASGAIADVLVQGVVYVCPIGTTPPGIY